MNPLPAMLRGWRPAWVALLLAALAPGHLPAEPVPTTVPASAPADDEQPARALFSRWTAAVGGVSRILHLRTRDYLCQFNFGPGQPPMEVHIRSRADGVYRYDYEVPHIGRLTQAFDGRFTWQRNDLLGFGQLTPADHYTNLAGVDFLEPIHVANMAVRRHKLPDETINGQVLQVAELADETGARAKWYFDPATGLRVRMEASTKTTALLMEYADFRDVQGLKEPFRIRRTLNGQTVEILVHEVSYDDDIDPELFAAPLGLVEDNQQIERILGDNRAAGGFEALQKITTRRTKALIEDTATGVKTQVIVSQKAPNLIVREVETPGLGLSRQGYDGQVAWAWSELEGYRTMAGAEREQMINAANLHGSLPISTLCPFRRLLDEKEDNGRRIIGIALASLRGVEGNFYFDTRTNELARSETFILQGPNGQLRAVEDYSDYRRVDGVLMAFRITLTNPAVHTVTTIESVEDNVPLDDALFVPKKE